MYLYGNGMDTKAPAPNYSQANGDFYRTNSVVQNFKPQVANPSSNMNLYSNMNTMTRALKSMSNFSNDAPVYFESYYELNPPSKKNPNMLIQTEIHNGTASSSNINASEHSHNYQ